jgi:hypothetical protein
MTPLNLKNNNDNMNDSRIIYIIYSYLCIKHFLFDICILKFKQKKSCEYRNMQKKNT